MFYPITECNNDEVEIGPHLQNNYIHDEHIVKISNTFQTKTKDGPIYVCTCCTENIFQTLGADM